ncbi:AraC family transcriptional regulator [Curtobacterium sp. 320]|uniref:AraC family transcriptional regulator n=1 Tax=Curtobacterium sp. 320 TaxID=2817749 RepID=UPI00285C96EF|nr:helix-turn-helix domain-containing protein [Curtobacterium sp. 320]MDR6574873.1 AraC family transcriptional regulator [Curtobacterium sp. 320]
MERWNEAIAAVEEHLDGGPDDTVLDVDELARITGTSEYHFRRVFSALAGMPLSEYVRRRRMTLAAAVIASGTTTVSDVAARFGYGSADAFGRAFRAVHGIGPQEAREPGAVLRSQGRLSFRLTVEGSTPVQYRLVQKPAFRLIGRSTRVPLVYEGPNDAIQAFERSITPEDRERIAGLSDQEPSGVLSVSDAFTEGRADGSLLRYSVVAATSVESAPGLDVIEVPAATWVVFSGSGPVPGSIQALWPQAFGEWLPANPYRLVAAPEIARVRLAPGGRTAEAELWLAVEPEPADDAG